MSLVFTLQQFSGPLDLLLHLIGDARIDIRDIFVSQVTDQYLQVVQQSGMEDMEEVSEFLQMAATLLLIKSRSLLPVEQKATNEEDNPEELLIRQLEEYAQFQQIASQMQGFEAAAARMFSKLPDEFPLPPPTFELEGLTLDGLIAALAKVSARILIAEEEQERPATITREQYTVPQCMANILRQVRRGSLQFSSLLSQQPTRNEVVTLFLALLELLKQGKLQVSQEGREQQLIISRNQQKGQVHEQ